ncbi:MAG: DUF255 domain-containing protein [Ferruginibacter sp.]
MTFFTKKHVYQHTGSGKTLQKARDKDSLLLVSIGYAAFNWCHVMQGESFDLAALAIQHRAQLDTTGIIFSSCKP